MDNPNARGKVLSTDIPGDMIFEGRHGNSIRIGSRWVNPYIMISNGRTLVITNEKKSNYYLYPLKKTPLELILDKDFLIKEIESLKGRNVDNKYYNFTILNNNNKINIFFNNKNYNLIGWQTEDIYQNLAITFISKVKTNQEIDDTIFKIPKMKMN